MPVRVLAKMRQGDGRSIEGAGEDERPSSTADVDGDRVVDETSSATIPSIIRGCTSTPGVGSRIVEIPMGGKMIAPPNLLCNRVSYCPSPNQGQKAVSAAMEAASSHAETQA